MRLNAGLLAALLTTATSFDRVPADARRIVKFSDTVTASLTFRQPVSELDVENVIRQVQNWGIREEGPELTLREADRLKIYLLNADSYAQTDRECAFRPSFLFEFRDGEALVPVLIDLECRQIWVEGIVLGLDPIHAILVAIAQGLFGHDDHIQRQRGYRPVTPGVASPRERAPAGPASIAEVLSPVEIELLEHATSASRALCSESDSRDSQVMISRDLDLMRQTLLDPKAYRPGSPGSVVRIPAVPPGSNCLASYWFHSARGSLRVELGSTYARFWRDSEFTDHAFKLWRVPFRLRE